MKITSFTKAGFIAVLILTIGSCKKDEVSETPTLGPEASRGTLEKAEDEVYLKLNPFATREGQMGIYILNMIVEQSPSRTLSEQRIRIKRRTETPTDLTLVVSSQETDFSSGSPEVGPEKDYEPWVIPKTQGQAIEGSFVVPNQIANGESEKIQAQLFQAVALLSGKPIQTRAARKVTIHNLTVTKGQRTPPPAVRQTPDCLGIPNCVLNVLNFTYDEAYWKEDGSFEKVKIEKSLSSDTPFLTPVVFECASQMAVVENQRYFIRVCRILNNFLY